MGNSLPILLRQDGIRMLVARSSELGATELKEKSNNFKREKWKPFVGILVRTKSSQEPTGDFISLTPLSRPLP